jgi:hypothetical protein
MMCVFYTIYYIIGTVKYNWKLLNSIVILKTIQLNCIYQLLNILKVINKKKKHFHHI